MDTDRFDHIVVAVKDLRKALATYREALGFTVVPSGEDVDGTTAAWVHIGDYAVELVAVREPLPAVRWLQEWLDIAKEKGRRRPGAEQVSFVQADTI